jgi:DNA-binding NtrC family response regulator
VSERILIVEDEATLCANIRRALARDGHDVTGVGTGAEALTALDARSFDLVITDLRLPDIDGLGVLARVREVSPDTVVLLMTAFASVDSAVEALRRGAHDYLLKPLSLADLSRKVAHIAAYRRLGRENARLRAAARGDGDPITLLRRGGPAMAALCALLEKVAASTSTVLVQGESGTGKELVARAVHDLSERREGPFLSLNVSAIPDALCESYLFGHERGAFTGAERRREGLFRAASGGTLFLDEIGELPAAVQAKLLRAVETKEILPVGSDRGVAVDVRIVAATHRDLAAMVAEGKFRQDLYYRLQVVRLALPPLRDRPGDVPALCEHLLARHGLAQKKHVGGIDADALDVLCAYAWPGNVRELSNVLERAVILCEGDTVTVADLPGELRATPPPAAPPSAPPSGLSVDAPADLDQATLAFQRVHIARVLARVNGNRDAAAKLLGLSPATLYRHLQRVGLKGFRGGAGDPPP